METTNEKETSSNSNTAYKNSDSSKSSQSNKNAEGPVAKAIEQQTAKLPSDTFLWLAVGAIALSAGLQIAGKEQKSNFVGQWAPTILILGLYNKIVKVLGSNGNQAQK